MCLILTLPRYPLLQILLCHCPPRPSPMSDWPAPTSGRQCQWLYDAMLALSTAHPNACSWPWPIPGSTPLLPMVPARLQTNTRILDGLILGQMVEHILNTVPLSD